MERFKKAIGPGISAVLFLAMFIFAYVTFGNEFSKVISWYLAMLLTGALIYPAVMMLFPDFSDRGWVFSKVFGILAPGYLMWLLSSLHILKFNFAASWICVIITQAAIFAFLYKRSRKKGSSGFIPAKIPVNAILLREVIFFASFLFFCYFRCFRPGAFGQEKMMDYGFMHRMFYTDYFPPEDFWYAGEKINYYYFGQYIFTFITRISGNKVDIGYNLSMATAFAFYMMLPFELAFELTGCARNAKNWHKHAAGFTAGCISLFSANMQYVIYGKIAPVIWDILQIEGEKPSYWYSNASRYIGEFPEVEDKTAIEFGAYSMVTGDLHAHVVNQLFVMTFLGLLLAYMITRSKERRDDKMNIWKISLLEPRIIICALLMGIFSMCNSWDVAIYYVVAGALLMAVNIVRCRKPLETAGVTAAQGILFIAAMFLLSLPFMLQFKPMASGIARVSRRSLFYQLVVLWGLPFGMFTAFFVNLFKGKKGLKFKGFMESLSVDEMYFMLTGLCAFGLVLIPEFIYLKDIYAGAYERFNTMFKLTYQTNSMLAVFFGYILIRFIFRPEMQGQRKWGIICFILQLVSCTYFFNYAKAWYGDYTKYSERESLTADHFVEREAPADMEAIRWIESSIAPGAVVLESQGSGYSLDDRVSVFAATRTVIGWHTHEWLWHDSLDAVRDREADVKKIYTSDNVNEVKMLLDKYDVEYIFVGSREYEWYREEGMDTDFLCSLGHVVFTVEDDLYNETVYVIDVD